MDVGTRGPVSFESLAVELRQVKARLSEHQAIEIISLGRVYWRYLNCTYFLDSKCTGEARDGA